ncbi:(2Fe-2S)-binding protein [Rhodococcus sp. NPDC057529]|uniref:(2Fe-2S)-binding protein n=1 Tax=Rhodococcus sp. NPDC057529 TaxID=3346158 RepID=UPI00366DD152
MTTGPEQPGHLTEAERPANNEPGLVCVSLTVNGSPVEVSAAPTRLLLEVLREDLGLQGTKSGCETTTCGACTVLVDGRSMKSCTVLAIQVRSSSITTIEGLADGDRLHPVQESFRRHHGSQCGFCTPGMVMACVSALAEDRIRDERSARRALKGNLCRCTGYQNIVSAVLDVATKESG